MRRLILILNMKITFSNPKAQYLSHKKEINKAILKVLESGYYILGQELNLFEKEFSKYIGCKYGIGVGSGTEALHISLKAYDIGPGDEVITVSNSAVATVQAIELVGATPVLVDIESEFYTIDSNKIEKAISEKTKAIIPVHLYGQAADMKSITKIAKKHKLLIIEDCSQAHGALYFGNKVGSLADAGCFSFYPTKNLGAYGDGGIIVTNDEQFAVRCQMIRQHGWKKHYISHISGFNSCLDELQAAILRVKLKYLDKDNKKRIKIANIYNKSLIKTNLVLPKERDNSAHVYHLYVVLSEKRNQLKKYLEKNNIFSEIHYPIPIHLQPAYKNKIKIIGKLKITEDLAEKVLSLPNYPQLKTSQLYKVIKTIKDYYNRR